MFKKKWVLWTAGIVAFEVAAWSISVYDMKTAPARLYQGRLVKSSDDPINSVVMSLAIIHFMILPFIVQIIAAGTATFMIFRYCTRRILLLLKPPPGGGI